MLVWLVWLVWLVGCGPPDWPVPSATLITSATAWRRRVRLAAPGGQRRQAASAGGLSGRAMAWDSSTAPVGVTRKRFSLRTPIRPGR
jgi:hypothetical protein